MKVSFLFPKDKIQIIEPTKCPIEFNCAFQEPVSTMTRRHYSYSGFLQVGDTLEVSQVYVRNRTAKFDDSISFKLLSGPTFDAIASDYKVEYLQLKSQLVADAKSDLVELDANNANFKYKNGKSDVFSSLKEPSDVYSKIGNNGVILSNRYTLEWILKSNINPIPRFNSVVRVAFSDFENVEYELI